MYKKLPPCDDKRSILIVSQYFWPEEFRINELAISFQDKGYKVTVLTGLPNYPYGSVFSNYQKKPSEYKDFHGIEILRVPLRPRKSGQLNLILNYLSFVLHASASGPWKIRGKKFDAVFVFATSPITVAIPAIVIKKIKKIPLTIWVLDLWPETLSSLGILRKTNIFYKLIEKTTKWIYKHTDLILISSDAFRIPIDRLNKLNRPIYFFPQWVENFYLEKQGKKLLDVPKELKDLTGKFIILFAGNLGAGQDFPSILDAAEILKNENDIKWVIVGDGRYFEWVNCEIQRRALTENIKLLGRYPSNEMPRFFANASALLVSLRSDEVYEKTIPGKLQSYLMSGKPVLGMMDGEGKRVLELAKAGLVADSGDSRKLAENILKLKKMDLSKQNEMGKLGRKYAVEHFDKETLISDILLKIPFKKI